MAIVEVVKREIKRVYKNRLFWTITFIVPLFMCFLICLIFSKGSPTNLPLAVFNEDNSEISRMFVTDYFKGVNSFDYIEDYKQITLEYTYEILKEVFLKDNTVISIIKNK